MSTHLFHCPPPVTSDHQVFNRMYSRSTFVDRRRRLRLCLLDGGGHGALPEAVPEPAPDAVQVAHAAGAGGRAAAGLH